MEASDARNKRKVGVLDVIRQEKANVHGRCDIDSFVAVVKNLNDFAPTLETGIFYKAQPYALVENVKMTGKCERRLRQSIHNIDSSKKRHAQLARNRRWKLERRVVTIIASGETGRNFGKDIHKR